MQTFDNLTEFVSAKLQNPAQCVEHMVGKCKYACANPLQQGNNRGLNSWHLHPRSLMCVRAYEEACFIFFFVASEYATRSNRLDGLAKGKGSPT